MNATNQSLIDEKKAATAAYHRAYYLRTREERKARGKVNGKAYLQAFPKSNRISNWRYMGVKLRPDETWNGLYKLFIDTLNCESCNVKFDKSVHNTRKCLDHDHDEPNYTRGIICHSCNKMDSWKVNMSPNSIYQKYL